MGKVQAVLKVLKPLTKHIKENKPFLVQRHKLLHSRVRKRQIFWRQLLCDQEVQ